LSISECGEIADLSVSGYTLEEIIEELKLPIECLANYEVLESYKSGLVHLYLTKKFDNATDKDIMEDTRFTQSLCDDFAIEFENTILEEKARIREINREEARLVSNPVQAGVKTLKVMEKNLTHYTQQVVERDVRTMVRKMQKGDTTDMLTALTTQMMQLQALGNKIAETVSRTDRYDIMNKFQNLHLKTMNETRKTVMAINEVCNPKRTTFVKNATQNNLKIENKKDIPNELPAPKEEDTIDAVTYCETQTRVQREDK